MSNTSSCINHDVAADSFITVIRLSELLSQVDQLEFPSSYFFEILMKDKFNDFVPHYVTDSADLPSLHRFV